MNILDYIPHGSENAVTRKQLGDLMGLSDREVRRMIKTSRRQENCILNMQNGDGYFQPDPQSAIDIMLARKWRNQERNRGKEVFHNLSSVQKFLIQAEGEAS